MSAKDAFLVFGRTGWIGSQMIGLLQTAEKHVVVAQSRLEDRTAVAKELDLIKPTHVVNAAGLTGRPNVDWCEFHKTEVIRVNVVGLLNLADLCEERGIHMTYFGTGCIYEYDDTHPMGSGHGFTENDPPNFHGSFYAHSKAVAEDLIKNYSNVLTLRVRMPLSDDLHPRNFISKITKYERVVNIPNSMTVLYDLLPISVKMSERRLVGVYNFTNPGVISHNEILDLYAKHIDPTFTYKNFSLEEQSRILQAGRSNNELDCRKLLQAVPDCQISHIKDSVVRLFHRMKRNLSSDSSCSP